MYKKLNIIISGGIEIQGAKTAILHREPPISDPIIEEYKFVAYRDGARISLREAVRLSTHIALEYHQAIHVKAIELIDESDNLTTEELVSPILTEVLGDLPLIQMNVLLVTQTDRFDTLPLNVNAIDSQQLAKEENALLVVGVGLLTRDKNDQLQQILPKLKNGGFVLTRERSSKPETLAGLSKLGLNVILQKSTDNESIILLKKREKLARKTEIVRVNNNEFSWVNKLNSIINAKNDDTGVILVGEEKFESGLLGFLNCLRRERGVKTVKGVLIQDKDAPEFSLQNPLYAEQLQLQLPVNVLRPGKIWGSYRHLPISSDLKPKLVRHATVDLTVCIV